MAGLNFGGKTKDARARTYDRLKWKSYAKDGLSKKEARRFKKMEKQVKKDEVRQVAREHRGQTKLTMVAICGCCMAELYYTSRERAEAAAASAAAKHCDLTDDFGKTEKVDGFYGCQLDDC